MRPSPPAGSPGTVGDQSAVDATNDAGFGAGFDDLGGLGGESDQGGAPSGGSQSGGHAGGYGGPGAGHGAGPTGSVSVGDLSVEGQPDEAPAPSEAPAPAVRGSCASRG